MKWVTYRGNDGDRVGVIAGDSIYAVAEGTTLIDLLAGGSDALCAAGEEAVRAPSAVVRLDAVRLRAPIPRPPAIRDSLCFLDHMRNCQQAMGGGRVLKD